MTGSIAVFGSQQAIEQANNELSNKLVVEPAFTTKK